MFQITALRHNFIEKDAKAPDAFLLELYPTKKMAIMLV
jgi:hypothetical protein